MNQGAARLSICMILAGVTGWAGWAFAHARLDPSKKLKPRSESSGLKTAPCGDVPATTEASERTELVAGSSLTVEWQETINHPGHFRLAFSEKNDEGFDDNILKDDIVDDQDGSVSSGDETTYHQFKTTIKVPDTTCDECTIQLIQVMTDRDPPTNYYSCADIRIVAAPNDETEKPAAPTGLKVTVKRRAGGAK